MKTVLGYVILAGVVAGLVLLNNLAAGREGKNALHVAPELEVEVRLAKPETRDIVRTVQAPGDVEAFTEVDISAEVVGKIIEMPVEEGDRVQAGDLLCRLDDADYRARVTSARANVEKLKAMIVQSDADMEKAQRDLDRQKRLSESDATSALELADYHTAFVRVKAALDMRRQELIEAEAMLTAAQDDLAKTVITSPIAGIVSQKFAELGEVVITGTMNNPGTRIMVISDLSKMQVRCRVDESDSTLVQVDQPARIYLQTDMQTSVPGHVLRVGTKGTKPLGRDVVTFETLVLVDSDDERVKPGMTASVDIEVRRSTNALTVPVEAVVNRKRKDLPEDLVKAFEETRTSGDHAAPLRTAEYLKCIFCRVDDKAQPHLVETGISDEHRVEIVSGLSPADWVIAGPYRSLDALKRDSRVKILNKDDFEELKDGGPASGRSKDKGGGNDNADPNAEPAGGDPSDRPEAGPPDQSPTMAGGPE